MPNAFGVYTPDDFDMDTSGMEWNEDVDIVFVTVHKARAEVIAVDNDRDRVQEMTEKMGFPGSEYTTVVAPFNVTEDDFSFPDRP